MSKSYDIAIIGGGIVGSSLAVHLAKENIKAVVINPSSSTGSATAAAAGLLTPFQLNELENPKLKDFCFKSFNYFGEFLELVNEKQDIDLGYRQAGSLYLIFSNHEFGKKECELREVKENEPSLSFLSKLDAVKCEPLVTKEIVGAYHYPSESYINNPKLLKAIHAHCHESKVTFINSNVNKINIQNNKVESVILNNGEEIHADKYVLCNGVWSNSLLKQALNTNEDFIKAIKGEIVQVEPMSDAPLLQKIVFCNDGYIVPRPQTNKFESPSILIGSTSEEIDLTKDENIFSNTVSGISSLVKLFEKLVPNNKNYKMTNTWSGLRPKTKDNLPIIGKVSEINNLYCSLGHYRNGILMGPYSGKILKDLLINNSAAEDVDMFNFDRLMSLQA